ncbi:hypothetical protein AB0A77_24645 [Streptomyces varsoviensis]|uniref:hypothetical protein n=1 Tax=Streptomyces varsoviensis TaxID=67373 RepID=UPI0033FFBF41
MPEVPVHEGEEDPSSDDPPPEESDSEGIERILGTVGDARDAEIRQQAVEAARQVMSQGMEMRDLAELTAETEATSRASAGPFPSSQEAFTQTEPDSQLEQLRQAVREVLKEKPKKPVIFLRMKFWAFVIPFLASATLAASSALTYILNCRKQAGELNGKPDPQSDKELTPEQKEMIRNQLKLWWKEEDEKFWERVQRYCDRWNPSVQQMVFEMNTIADMSAPVSPPWTWASDNIKYDLVMELAGDFAAAAKPKSAGTPISGGTSPGEGAGAATAWDQFFKKLTGYTYDGYGTGALSPLPRKIAADVAHLAFSQVFLQWEQQLKPPVSGA